MQTTLQDSKKNFLKSIGVETVKFEMASSYEEIKIAIENIGLPVVIKTSRFGYDGKGQKVIYKKEEIEKIVSEFIDVQVIIEEAEEAKKALEEAGATVELK